MATAVFVKMDTTTQGSWSGVYGADGYVLCEGQQSLPDYVAPAPSGKSDYTWAFSTTDARGLQLPPPATARIAACWYSPMSFSVDLNFTDGNTHELAVYLLDWDGYQGGRNETVTILDGVTGAVLDTRFAIDFEAGEYLVWTVSGHVVLQVVNVNTQANAVISGLFFATPAATVVPTGGGVVVAPASGGAVKLLPANNIWNTPVDTLPVLPNSAAIIAAMAATSVKLRCDDSYPLNVCANPPMVEVAGLQAPQSDPGLYGIPAGAQIEPTSDKHLLVIDTAGEMIYELFGAAVDANGNYSASSGAKWDLNSNAMRAIDPSEGETTSADAAGLPMSPGVVQYAEALAGAITHCLRMTSNPTINGLNWPATHFAGNGSTGPRMGQRLRLQASFDLTPYTGAALAILTALKKYGAMIADNGLSFATQHDTDPRWDPTNLLTLHAVPGTAFEVVDVSGLIVSTAFMQAGQSGAPSLLMVDRLGRSTPVLIGPGLTVTSGQITTGSNL